MTRILTKNAILALLLITLICVSTMQMIPTATCATSNLQKYLEALAKLKQPIEVGDRNSAAQVVDELSEAEATLTYEMDSIFYKLRALQPQALAKVKGFEGNYTKAVDSYSQTYAKAADLYSSLASWLGGDDVDGGQLLTKISEASEATQQAWDALSYTLGITTGLKAPAILAAYLDVPVSVQNKASMEVTANVTNFGDEPAKNVLATLSTYSTLDVFSPAIFSLSTIPPGVTSQAKWTLRVSPFAQPGDVAALWATVEGDGLEAIELNSATTVTFGDEGRLEFTVHSPVLMFVTDYLGRSVGFDPNSDGELSEIPGATYTGRASSPQTIVVPDPLGTYRVDLLGTADGSYQLEIKALQKEGLASIQTIEGSAKKDAWETIMTPVTLTDGAILLTSGQTLPWVKVHEIRFEYDKLWKPRDVITGSSDARNLAFALEYLEFLDDEGNALGRIDAGGEKAGKYLDYGWNDDVEGSEASYVWAGDPSKYATINTRMPEGTSYLVARTNPLRSNSSVTVSVDGKAIARVNPITGWKNYRISTNKTMSLVTCGASSKNVTLSDSVNIVGSLMPKIQGTTVNIKITKPSGQLSSATTTSNGEGEYSYSLKPDEKGDWLIQSSWQGNEDYSNTTSYEVRLRVNEAKPTSSAGGISSYTPESILLGLALGAVLVIRLSKDKRMARLGSLSG